MQRLLLALVLALLGAPSRADEAPPANYENWGVCPFECCTYREWTADDDVPVHQGRSDASPVVFHLRRDESFDAVTGVVVTERAAAVTIDAPVREGYAKGSDAPQLDLKKGNTVYLLSPVGEGNWLFWYRGKVYLSGDALSPAIAPQEASVKMRWWKLVRNHAGVTGWTSSDKFKNADACG